MLVVTIVAEGFCYSSADIARAEMPGLPVYAGAQQF